MVVVVGQGRALSSFEAPFAVGVLDADDLRRSGPMVNLSEALQRLPGLSAGLRHNHAQDLQISSRGFGARATFGVRGIRLLADGIPAAGPDGQGQVNHFDLAGAHRIEVLRGPFSALYGTSSGGAIVLVSRSPQVREAELASDVGSFGQRQVRVSVGAPLGGGFSLRVGASDFEVQGFRPQSQAQRQLANLRLGFDGVRDRVVLVFNEMNQPAQDPLGLTRVQFAANPDGVAAQALQFNTRKEQAQRQLGLQWQHRFDGDRALLPSRSSLALYRGERRVTQWQSIAPATQANPRHPGGVIDFDRVFEGLDARLVWRIGAAELHTGLALDAQHEHRRGFQNFIGTGSAQQLGVTGALRRDERNRSQSRDAYAQLEWPLAEAWALHAGLRQGRLKLRSADRFLSNGDDSGALAFAYRLPVLALRHALSPTLNLYASWGRGHESPTLGELAYRPDGLGGLNAALRPQRSRQWELGTKWRPGGGSGGAGWQVDAALFGARSEDEIGVLSNAGGRSTFQNIGPTRRTGAELSLSGALAAQWRLHVAATLLRATVQQGFLACAGVPCTAPTLPVAAGSRIAGTLPRSLFAELAWQPGPWELAAELRAQGRQPVNDANSDFAAGHALLALRARWVQALGEGARLEAMLRLENLANRRVAGTVIVNEANQRFFEPAPGRNAMLSLRWVQGF
jgi:iron complex outermembrane receptor protein